MNLEKIKEVLKSKRTLVISTVLIGALTITVAGTMMLHNKNTENNKVAVEKQDNEQLENVVEEESEDLTVDNIVEDNEAVENTNEHIHDENCNHDTENSTSQENNQEVAQNSDTNKQENTTESSDKKATTITSQTSTNKNDSTSNSNVNKNEHTHSWVEVYKDVYHDEVGHWENVLVKEAWIESVPVYEEQYRAICNTCGADITSNYIEHSKNHMLNGENGSYKNVPMQVQVGTNTINHDAVYEKKWIVDKQAWTEKVLSGYKCSECGSTK